MDNPQERLISKDFAAGLIVGEGWFGLTVQKRPRLKTKFGFSIMPRFCLQMQDRATVERFVASLKRWGLAVWVNDTQRGMRVEACGLKRVGRLVEFFLSRLTGQKRLAAMTVKKFIDLRLSKAQCEPYDEREFSLVEIIRQVNAGEKRQRISLAKVREVRAHNKRVRNRWESESSEAICCAS